MRRRMNSPLDDRNPSLSPRRPGKARFAGWQQGWRLALGWELPRGRGAVLAPRKEGQRSVRPLASATHPRTRRAQARWPTLWRWGQMSCACSSLEEYTPAYCPAHSRAGRRGGRRRWRGRRGGSRRSGRRGGWCRRGLIDGSRCRRRQGRGSDDVSLAETGVGFIDDNLLHGFVLIHPACAAYRTII